MTLPRRSPWSPLLEEEHHCPVCGTPTDDTNEQGRKRTYCSSRCRATAGARRSRRTYAKRRSVSVTCLQCYEPYAPPSVCDPYCSLRCAHGKRRRVAA